VRTLRQPEILTFDELYQRAARDDRWQIIIGGGGRGRAG
jgi:hypothetical protein